MHTITRRLAARRLAPPLGATESDRTRCGGAPVRASLPGAWVVLTALLSLGGCAGSGSRTPEPGIPEASSGPAADSAGEQRANSGTDTPAGAPAVEAVPDAPLPRDRDLDADRVADVGDDCPDTAAGEIVDASGCALFSGVLEGVSFAPSDHRLDAASREALNGLAAELEAHPEVVLRIEGHTDNRGTAATNLELSKRRVMAVARFLVSSGVAPERLKPYGYGESRPRAGNATEAGRERNRRIEIERWRPAASLADPADAGQNATDAE